jgi:hypothetical protein
MRDSSLLLLIVINCSHLTNEGAVKPLSVVGSTRTWEDTGRPWRLIAATIVFG